MRLVHCLRTVLNWRIVCLTAPPQITSSTFCCCASGPPPTCAHMPTTSSPLCWRQAALRFAMLRCAALGWAGLGWARAGLWRAAFRAVLTSKQDLLLNTPFATCPAICLQEDLAASAGGDDAFEAYCAELEGTAAWGGQVELQVGAPTASVGCQICRSLQFDAELRGRAARWSCRWAPAQQAGVVKSASSAQWRPLGVCCGEQTGRAARRNSRMVAQPNSRMARRNCRLAVQPADDSHWSVGSCPSSCAMQALSGALQSHIQVFTLSAGLMIRAEHQDPSCPHSCCHCRRWPRRCSPTSRSSRSACRCWSWGRSSRVSNGGAARGPPGGRQGAARGLPGGCQAPHLFAVLCGQASKHRGWA